MVCNWSMAQAEITVLLFCYLKYAYLLNICLTVDVYFMYISRQHFWFYFVSSVLDSWFQTAISRDEPRVDLG